MTTHLPTANYPRFHLAFPVTDLGQARRFYGDFLGCAEGRSSDDGSTSISMATRSSRTRSRRAEMADATSLVDGQNVPVRHFGVDPRSAGWEALAARLVAAGTKFIIEPYVRFRGLPGEQATMFFLDPFGNALEFKAFADINRLFATEARSACAS